MSTSPRCGSPRSAATSGSASARYATSGRTWSSRSSRPVPAEGKYTSFVDFVEKSELVCCNKRVIESLDQGRRVRLLRASPARTHRGARGGRGRGRRPQAPGRPWASSTCSAAGDTEPDTTSSPLAHLRLDAEEWPHKQLLSFEREMLGLYVSAHPLDGADHITAQGRAEVDRRDPGQPAARGRAGHRRDDLVAGTPGDQEG